MIMNGFGVFHPAAFPVPQMPVQASPQASLQYMMPGNPVGPQMGMGAFHPAAFPVPQMPVQGGLGSYYNGLGCTTGGCGCAQQADMVDSGGLMRMLPWLIVAAIAYWLYTQNKDNKN